MQYIHKKNKNLKSLIVRVYSCSDICARIPGIMKKQFYINGLQIYLLIYFTSKVVGRLDYTGLEINNIIYYSKTRWRHEKGKQLIKIVETSCMVFVLWRFVEQKISYITGLTFKQHSRRNAENISQIY